MAATATEGGAGGESLDIKASEALAPEFFEKAGSRFEGNPMRRMAQNVVATNGHLSGLVTRKAIVRAEKPWAFSTTVGREGEATSQKSSGRCWIFACLNTMRLAMMKKYKLPSSFQFSQTFAFYFDKLEKANWFLEQVLDTLDEASDSRMVQHLLSAPVNDGGQWDMLVSLIEKYGVLPRTEMPEAHSSTMSRYMNWMITNKLRQFCRDLRKQAAAGASGDELRAAKMDMMATIHDIVTVSLGTPPTSFDWRYKDTDGVFHEHKGLTPLQFYRDFVPFNMNDMVSIVNDPRNKYGTLLTVSRLGNVVGGQPVRYVNLDIDALKRVARATLEKGDPVWFGCDVGKRYNRLLGTMDVDLYDYEGMFGTVPSMSKADRLEYNESAMTHAMVFTGVDCDGPKTLKWRVENSWGSDVGDKGYFLMTDAWFSEFMYQVVVHKDMLTEEELATLKTEPTVLPPWDPMGALAQPDGPASSL